MTSSFILGSAEQILMQGGYTRVKDSFLGEFSEITTRVFEDYYSIVAIVAYDTWQDLMVGWPDAQTSLVNLISKYCRATDAKSWDGYLVLLTPGRCDPTQEEVASAIRYDTSRVRKLVATGGDLNSLVDLRRALSCLLPIAMDTRPLVEKSVVKSLPRLLAQKGIDQPSVEVIVKAFLDQQPMVEALHNFRNPNATQKS